MPMIKGKLPQRKRLPGIKQIIACSSAKGGVGKSTVAGMVRTREIYISDYIQQILHLLSVS